MLCLLFQQFAVAAYACTVTTRMPSVSVAMQDCGSMRMQHARENPPLCAKHCAPDVSVAADQHAPTVPPLALAPLAHTAVTAVQPTQRLVSIATAAFHRSDPPPRLRYCSLQI